MCPMGSKLFQDTTSDHYNLNDQDHPFATDLIAWIGAGDTADHGSNILQCYMDKILVLAS